MRKSNSSEKSVLIPADAVLCDVSTDKKAAKALEAIRSKYAHAMTEQVWRHEKKIGVLIACTSPGCSAQRFLHSSDLWQCDTCPEHRKGATKPVAPKPEKGPRRGARSKDAPKATRKSRKAPKATRRARKARSVSPATASAE